MTQVTERGTPLRTAPRAAARRRSPAAAACVLGGAMAAGLGLGFLAVLVIVLWISSPYPDSGPGGALHLAAGLWLMAHGTELVRYETLSGVPAPVGLTPLLLVALPVLLMRRAARLGSASGDPVGEGEESEEVLPASAVFSAVLCGYLSVAAVATAYAAGGPLPADPLSAAWHVPLVAVLAAGLGVWTAKGRPLGPLPEWVPDGVRRGIARPRYALALRSGLAGVLALLGGGVLLVGASLAWHASEAQSSFLTLTGVWSGRFAVLLLALALIPNAMVWGAAYGLGPGFALGTGATATPLGFEGAAALPRFPLLAALPPEGPGTPLTWAAAGVPVAAGLVVGWFAVRRAREVSLGETALTAALGAVVCGLVTAGLGAASSGPLGSRALASFGPVWWQVGAAAAGWTLALAVPVAVGVHGWRTRPVRGFPEGGAGGRGADAWHDSGVRELRWEALREASTPMVAAPAPKAFRPKGAVPPGVGPAVRAPARPLPPSAVPVSPAAPVAPLSPAVRAAPVSPSVPVSPALAAPPSPAVRVAPPAPVPDPVPPRPVPQAVGAPAEEPPVAAVRVSAHPAERVESRPGPSGSPEPGELLPPVAGARVLARRPSSP
ncbi:DUF6350 family protein [Streptomyces sp. NPDC048606]|uniref:cell division protein PerM n=1 Tax=Streptomyces sp. NPDC048606 TaxID=3154726 RepID=UPI0034120AD8